MILGLFTAFFHAGGVGRISQHAGAVLAGVARDLGQPYRLLSLNDPPGDHEVQVGDLSFTIRGFGRAKGRFLLSVAAAGSRSGVAYIGHWNLAPLGLLLRLTRPSVRYIVATHGVEVWEPLPLLPLTGLRLASAVTAPSQFTAQRVLGAQRVNPRKVITLPWALHPQFLSVDGAASRPDLPQGKVLLTVARLEASERQKGIDTVIQALPRVLSLVPDTHYVIVGDGDDRPRLERLAKDAGVAEHVIFVGGASDQEVAGYYDACDSFVMPSRQEGFGLVFLEAMAFGKPVVGCTSGGIPEVVVDGETGFLVGYGDLDALVSRLVTLLQDPELRKRLGEAGRQRATASYGFEQFRRGLTRLLTGSDGAREAS